MYTVTFKREFFAKHFLIFGGRETENQEHAHHYQIAIQLEGAKLDKHGYLVNMTDIENALSSIVNYYRDRTLNGLPEFVGLNPSLEQFARILYQTLASKIQAPNLSAMTVTVWENELTSAAYRQERRAYTPRPERNA